MSAGAEQAEVREAQMRREFVSREEFHGRLSEPPTRGEFREEFANMRADNAEFRREMNANFAELRKDIRALCRLAIALLLLVGGSMVTVAVAAVKVMAGL